MKKQVFRMFKSNLFIKSIVFLLLFTIFQSCKKSTGSSTTNTTGFSDSINKIVSPEIIDSLKAWGMTINAGQQPPTINGIYFDSPNYCTYDNSSSQRAGTTFDDYKYKFYGQDNSNLTIKINFKDVGNPGTDSASGEGAFLAGNGNSFSAFIDTKGVESGINYDEISIFSGQVTTVGIANWQYAFYFKSKGDDPNNLLVNVGDCRIFDVGGTGGVADKTSTYSVINNGKIVDGIKFGSMIATKQ